MDWGGRKNVLVAKYYFTLIILGPDCLLAVTQCAGESGNWETIIARSGRKGGGSGGLRRPGNVGCSLMGLDWDWVAAGVYVCGCGSRLRCQGPGPAGWSGVWSGSSSSSSQATATAGGCGQSTAQQHVRCGQCCVCCAIKAAFVESRYTSYPLAGLRPGSRRSVRRTRSGTMCCRCEMTVWGALRGVSRAKCSVHPEITTSTRDDRERLNDYKYWVH